MKINIRKLLVSFLIMVGITSCLIIQVNGNGDWWNIVNYLFFELVGIYIIYSGINDFGFRNSEGERT